MLNKLKEFIWFLKDAYKNKSIILNLAKNDFKVKYVNSYLGTLWGFIQPAITILVFWFVFEVGFKTPPVEDFPFLLWIICGIIPWTFFGEALTSGTNCLLEYSYLVKKVVFRVSILPIIKIISALVVHLFFILVILLLFALYGFIPTIYNLQVFYYIVCMIVLLLGLTWITSSLSVFIRDISQFISIILQVGFWFTPIIWSFDMIEEQYQLVFKLNPMFYIIQGFRDSFINKTFFWQGDRAYLTIYFWLLSSVVFIIGAVMFRKLRSHFADAI